MVNIYIRKNGNMTVYRTNLKMVYSIEQNKTKQNKTKQNKTKQNHKIHALRKETIVFD